MTASWTGYAYLISSVLFILALRGLSSPVTARRGNLMGIIGMMIHEGLTGNPIWPIDYEPGHFPLIPLEAVWPGLFSMGNPYPSI